MTAFDARSPVSGFAAVLFAVSLLCGCGSESGQQECSVNEDCPDSQVCTGEICVEPGAGDATTDGDSGACYEYQGSCVRDECGGDAADTCQRVTCPINCETWEELEGCDCVRRSCTSVDDCYDFACIDGKCRRCESDADCSGDRICHPSGRCLSGKPCEEDDDCAARKECSDRGECVERDECLVDGDCGDDEICFNGRCTYSPECEEDSDCREGMECVGEQCYEEICRGPEDCEDGEVCAAGECIEPPEASECFVATPDSTISENSRIRLKAYAIDGQGRGVPASFEWNSSDPSVAAIDSSGDYAVGGSASGTATITATLADGSGTSCEGSAELTNPGSLQSGNVRVVVTSAKGRQAVSGAEVVVPSSGSATTGGAGVAQLSKPSGDFTVSVFHPDYNYLTVQGVQASDIRLPVREKEGSGPVAGFKGEFDKSKLHTQGDVTLGLAGSSISGGLLEVGLDQLLGRPVVREIQTPQGDQQIPLPSGLVMFGQVLGFDLDVKEKYFTTSPGGARIGWGLAGEVPAQRLLELFQNGLDNPLATLLPLFNRFDHAERPLQLTAKPRVTDSGDFDGDGDTSEEIPDYQNFPTVDLQPSVRQNLVTAVTVSNFPSLPNGDAEFAVLVGGNLQSGAGMVPLGISATTDDDGDGVPDLRNLSMAPPHGSITGGRYAVMALAFRTDGLSPQGGLALPNNLSAALWTRQSLPKQVGLGTFPDATTGTVDASNRKIDLTADAGPMYRFQFVGDSRTWEVWTTGPQGSMGTYKYTADIPSVPGSRTDLFTDGDATLVDAIQVSVTLDELVKSTGIGLRRVGRVATGFNRTELQ